jgi:hypothetical protein
MKTMVSLINGALIIVIAYACLFRNGPSDWQSCLGILAGLAFLVCNLVAISRKPGRPGWLSLYLRRKTLEEQAKIVMLEKRSSEGSAKADSP